MLGKTLIAIIAACLLIVAGLLVYSEYELPPGIDSRVTHPDEGIGFDYLDVSLVASDKDERQGRRVIVLNSGWAYVSAIEEDNPQIIIVSQYFKSDFASIPKPYDRLINPFGRHAEAAVLHDWLYAVGKKRDRRTEASIERKQADVIFYDAMRQLRVPWLRRRLMFAAVRLGGGNAFGREEEWSTNFHVPFLESDLPENCIIAGIPKHNEFALSDFSQPRLRNRQYLANSEFWRLNETVTTFNGQPSLHIDADRRLDGIQTEILDPNNSVEDFIAYWKQRYNLNGRSYLAQFWARELLVGKCGEATKQAWLDHIREKNASFYDLMRSNGVSERDVDARIRQDARDYLVYLTAQDTYMYQDLHLLLSEPLATD